MKAKRIISLVLAIISVCAVLSSCGSVVTIKDVRFAAILEEPVKDGKPGDVKQTLLVDVLVGDIEGSADEPLTVLDGVIALLEENGIPHKTDGKSITSIKNKSEKSSNGYSYVWEYTINGKEPEGRAYDIELQEGDKIVYFLRPTADKTSSSGTEDTEETVAE